MKLRQILILVFAVFILATVNFKVVQKERLIAEGQAVFLELGPRDPRSLLQGDYMALRYDIASQLNANDLPNDGHLVLKLDGDNIASFVRVHDSQQSLAEDEILLRYRVRDRNIGLGAVSFFMQEGYGKYYEGARYGELRVTPSGDSVLVGLRGPQLEELGPPESE